MTISDAALVITAFLGRPPTPAELAVYSAQKANLETGIFDNPLIPRDIATHDGTSEPRTDLVTIPFAPASMFPR